MHGNYPVHAVVLLPGLLVAWVGTRDRDPLGQSACREPRRGPLEWRGTSPTADGCAYASAIVFVVVVLLAVLGGYYS